MQADLSHFRFMPQPSSREISPLCSATVIKKAKNVSIRFAKISPSSRSIAFIDTQKILVRPKRASDIAVFGARRQKPPQKHSRAPRKKIAKQRDEINRRKIFRFNYSGFLCDRK
jgi:hypothetical protein